MTQPGTQRQALGEGLRALRTRAGLTAVDLAANLNRDQSHITRIETGERRITKDVLAAWLRFTGASADVATNLTELAERANAEHKADRHRAARGSAEGQRRYRDLENRAARIYAYHPSALPALLSAPEYTATTLRAVLHLDDRRLAAAITDRMNRQRILYDPATRYHAIVPEHVLRDAQPGRAVMLEQLRRLAHLATLPTVDLAVLPLDADNAPPTAFDLFELPPSNAPVALVVLSSGQMQHAVADDARAYRTQHDALRRQALTGKAAITLVNRIATDTTTAIFTSGGPRATAKSPAHAPAATHPPA